MGKPWDRVKFTCGYPLKTCKLCGGDYTPLASCPWWSFCTPDCRGIYHAEMHRIDFGHYPGRKCGQSDCKRIKQKRVIMAGWMGHKHASWDEFVNLVGNQWLSEDAG